MTNATFPLHVVPAAPLIAFDLLACSRGAEIGCGAGRRGAGGRSGAAPGAGASAPHAHPETKHKKPQFQYSLYHKCGFLHSISGCTCAVPSAVPAWATISCYVRAMSGAVLPLDDHATRVLYQEPY
eukprot:1506477-Rhodomonas_salina.2